MRSETWRDIPGWETYYQCSDRGRVRSLERTITYKDGRQRRWKNRILKPATDKRSGYLHVQLSRNGSGTKMYLHNAVLLGFVGPRPDGMEALHGNGNPADNRLENLRWGTRSENMGDRVRHGRHHNANKDSCPIGHVLDFPNLHAPTFRQGKRRCLACLKAYKSTYNNPELKPYRDDMAHQFYQSIIKENI